MQNRVHTILESYIGNYYQKYLNVIVLRQRGELAKKEQNCHP